MKADIRSVPSPAAVQQMLEQHGSSTSNSCGLSFIVSGCCCCSCWLSMKSVLLIIGCIIKLQTLFIMLPVAEKKQSLHHYQQYHWTLSLLLATELNKIIVMIIIFTNFIIVMLSVAQHGVCHASCYILFFNKLNIPHRVYKCRKLRWSKLSVGDPVHFECKAFTVDCFKFNKF